jgi:ATP-dependent Clp protease protease subunit
MPKILTLPGAKAKTPNGYRVQAKAGGNSAEIYLYGVIGQSFWDEGITAKQFKDDLAKLGNNIQQLDIRINSDGGDVFDGRTIYNLLLQHKANKTVYVDGLAASIASLIAMAGNKIVMGDGAFMMIHNAWGVAVGNGSEMRRVADLLDSVSGTLIDTYAARTKLARDEIVTMMDAETWMPSSEAVEKGFADEVVQGVKVAAMAIRAEANFKHVPEQLRPNRAAAAAVMERTAKKS